MILLFCGCGRSALAPALIFIRPGTPGGCTMFLSSTWRHARPETRDPNFLLRGVQTVARVMNPDHRQKTHVCSYVPSRLSSMKKYKMLYNSTWLATVEAPCLHRGIKTKTSWDKSAILQSLYKFEILQTSPPPPLLLSKTILYQSVRHRDVP